MSKWSCMADCFAKVFDISIKHMYEHLGHDGSQIVWPELPDPQCRRGFHPQEFVGVGLCLHKAVVQIERFPMSQPIPGVRPFPLRDRKINWCPILDPHGNSTNGVYTGVCKTRFVRHAIAVKDNQLWDPAGIVKFLTDFEVENYFAVFEIKSERKDATII